MGLSTEAKARYNKTNRHNSHVARVRASSSTSVKGAVRYIFGASIFTNFSTVYLYVKKTVYKGTNTIYILSHTYIKIMLFRRGCSFSSVFYFYFY